MKKNKKKESILLCMKYGSNCKLCPRSAKCDEEYTKPKAEAKGQILKLEKR